MNRCFSSFNYIADGICIIDSTYTIRYWNTQLETMTGILKEELIGKNIELYSSVFTQPRYRMRLEDIFSGGAPVIFSSQLHGILFPGKTDNYSTIQHIIVTGMPRENSREFFAVFTIKDISELSKKIEDYRAAQQKALEEIETRKIIEKQLKNALDDKDILIKEVHHRVKNNLMLIGSIIGIQLARLKSGKTSSILADLRNRIDSISLIHEKLYRSKTMTSINFKEYGEDLVNTIKRSMIDSTSSVSFTVEIDPVILKPEIAIPLGLIITEIITNALKYGVKDEGDGVIMVKFTCRPEGTCKLTVSDNGMGFPEGFDPLTQDSLGFKVIYALTEQLNADLTIKNAPGATHIIVLNLEEVCLEK